MLTKFVVSQALEELLDQDGHRTTAEEILSLSVCEPALGSGAFAIEAVRQLAEQYLDRREHETGERIDPDERPRELQKAKTAIALHQVYGVDLNATAVELAEISLWLDTMVDGLKAPWFGLRLRRGNSLIGARRAVYTQKQVTDKAWLNDTPTDVPVSTLVDDMNEGRVGSATSGKIHHFLLPADGWGSAVDAKEAKELAPDAHVALRAWRNAIRRKPTNAQLKRLTALGHRVETLWQFTLRRLEIAEAQVSRDITLWNDPRTMPDYGGAQVSRADIEEFLRDPDGAYQRLRRVMDAWCALWFWPLTDTVTRGVTPPTLDEWIEGLEATLGRHSEAKPRRGGEGAQTLGLPTTWGNLADAEGVDLGYAGAGSSSELETQFPWLRVAREVGAANGFFHWELDFAGVFARGGFDLQVGNPPWVRPEFDEDAVLAEHDVTWAVSSASTGDDREERKRHTLTDPSALGAYVDEAVGTSATRAAISAPAQYRHLAGLRPDLYRCFVSRTWDLSAARGVVGLIHPDTHFTEERAAVLRAAMYPRMRRHWQFYNEMGLFEIHHDRMFSVSIYGAPRDGVSFLSATGLFAPATVERSLDHDGSGPAPTLREPDGSWSVRPHLARVTRVTPAMLRFWSEVAEGGASSVDGPRMVTAVDGRLLDSLGRIHGQARLGELSPRFSEGWNETTDFRKGRFARSLRTPDSLRHVILQGSHIFIGNPAYKEPRSADAKTLWDVVDTEALAIDYVPSTELQPVADAAYWDSYRGWDEFGSPRDHYRIAWRRMANNKNERTLISAVIPPGPSTVQTLQSFAFPDAPPVLLPLVAGQLASIVLDGLVRAVPKNDVLQATLARLPVVGLDHPLAPSIAARALRLNCLWVAYRELWEACVESLIAAPSSDRVVRNLPLSWTPSVAARTAVDRRSVHIEIDALTALALGQTADDLVRSYRAQFSVLQGYERSRHYDANGRLVPNEVLKVWRQKGDAITQDERRATNASGNTYEYELPFVTLDREADMRQAYAHFEQILQERS